MTSKITLISTFLGSATWLIYWTGRWYKEWYFNQFKIPYEALGFNPHYYLFASWLTILVALAGFIIVINVLFSILLKCSLGYIVLSFVPIALSILVFLFDPIKFHPDRSFIFKIIGSKDLMIICLGICAFVQTFINKIQNSKDFDMLIERVNTYFQHNFLFIIISIIISCWLYLGIVGHFVGVYHGKSAINFGKMGIKYAQVDNHWWMFVVRTDDGRNFLFDKETKTVFIVKDDLIKSTTDSVPANN